MPPGQGDRGPGASGLTRAADLGSTLRQDLDVRVVYVDLDGTLMGPGGSLFAHPDGPTSEPAAAVGELHLAGVDLVLVSGRTRLQVSELARALGAAGYIAEIGGLIVQRRGRDEILTPNLGAFRGSGPGTPFEAIQRSGVVGMLLEEYRGRLEPHAPWAFLERECSMLLRGDIDLDGARIGRASCRERV